MTGAIQKATQEKGNLAQQAQAGAKKSINALMSSILDSEGYRRRFNELLGARTPQFISSIVSLVNADNNLQRAFYEAPVTVIQSALKAATFNRSIRISAMPTSFRSTTERKIRTGPKRSAWKRPSSWVTRG